MREALASSMTLLTYCRSALLGMLGLGLVLTATPSAAEGLDIKRLTLEQLMEISVVTPSRRAESYQSSPSALYVLTGDDIQRAHVTSLPEALRLIPGVQVARLDASKWSVSIRGFGSRTANKLLVLFDGRSVYDPLFSGVFWESRDVMLEDVERIEVIRGPGGALWQTNAVNGVINIITKRASDTQGTLWTAGAGTEERAFGAVRYGWQPQSDQYARVYAKTTERDTGAAASGAHDDMRLVRTGYRWDWVADARDDMQVSGDFYNGDFGEADAATGQVQDVNHQGANLLARWQRKLSATENFRLQFFYDYFEFDNLQLGETRNTYDFEFQHGLTPLPDHQLVWGFGHRRTRDDIRNGPVISIDPSARADVTTNLFVQDTIALVPDRWQLTLGTKVERNNYSGSEWQPNVRLAWTVNANQTAWAAASRAVRVPSRLERDLVFAGSRLGDDFDPERVYAYELGFRHLLSPRIWYDVAAFYNDYRALLTLEQDFMFENRMNGHTYGVELATRWQLTPAWRLDAGYTYLRMNLEVDADSIDVTRPEIMEGSDPQQQITLRSAYDYSRTWQFDATLYHCDELPTFDVPAYTKLDVGVTWLMRPRWQVSLVGQDLLDSHHPESAGTSTTEVQRGFYGKLRVEF
ncbi:MAG: TonB-dependent receptor [Gammaproteobacteria bacterium]|nr:TonB-dependent receptor [Gammaproteobacteria bacterium]